MLDLQFNIPEDMGCTDERLYIPDNMIPVDTVSIDELIEIENQKFNNMDFN